MKEMIFHKGCLGSYVLDLASYEIMRHVGVVLGHEFQTEEFIDCRQQPGWS